MLTDAELNGKLLVATIDEIMSNDTLRSQMAAASKKEGIPDASQRLHALVRELTQK